MVISGVVMRHFNFQVVQIETAHEKALFNHCACLKKLLLER